MPRETKGSLRARLGKVESLGDFKLVTAQMGDQRFRAKIAIGERVSPEPEIGFMIPETHVQIFENEKSL